MFHTTWDPAEGAVLEDSFCPHSRDSVECQLHESWGLHSLPAIFFFFYLAFISDKIFSVLFIM